MTEAVDDSLATQHYAKLLGNRLRAIRSQQHLSLHGVERKSGGRWKAVVVGSYERGDRAVSVPRLAELAEFYGVPVSELLPRDRRPAPADAGPALAKIVINLDRAQSMTDPEAEPLLRLVGAIQRMRGDYTSTTLAIRYDDLRSLGLLYDTTPEGVTRLLVQWQVLAPDSLILDGEPA